MISRVPEEDDRGPDLHRLSLFREEPQDLPRDGGRDLDGDLVRHHFDHQVVLADRGALLDEPLHDLALVDALADVGELELAGQSTTRGVEGRSG